RAEAQRADEQAGTAEMAIVHGRRPYADSGGVFRSPPREQPAGDHDPLDLVRALTDDHQRRVAVVTLDGELLRVAVAAVDAHRFGGQFEGSLGAEQLGHRSE